MLKEFKEFAFEGNVVDLAIGVIIGAAFGKIVSSLVNDIIMPVVGKLVGNVDFSELFISLDKVKYDSLAQAQEAGASTLNYGMFINVIIEFLIIAFALFMIIKQVNKFKKKEPVADPTTKTCQFCLTEIPLKAKKCPNCTSVLEDEVVVTPKG